MSGSIWLGQHVESRLMSLGDFGSVRVNIAYDAFKKPSGFFCYIYSLQLLLFTQEIEFLHRLPDEKKESLQLDLASIVKKRYEDGDL